MKTGMEIIMETEIIKKEISPFTVDLKIMAIPILEEFEGPALADIPLNNAAIIGGAINTRGKVLMTTKESAHI